MMGTEEKLIKGAIWSGIEKVSVQIVSFVVGIVLARLLTPTEYGTVGLLIVFISISQVFIDSGFSKALIQKQGRTEIDISTVFYFNFAIAVLCYIILWFAAPSVAEFYKIPNLEGLLRVLAFSLLFNGLSAIPNTLLSIEMNFKALSKVTLTATIISGIVAIILAYQGFGEWALVWQTLIRTFLMTIFIWILVKWWPKLIFSTTSFKELFSFGSKLLLSSLLMNLNSNFSSLFIAKILDTKQLGFFTRGTQFADTLYSTMSTVMNNVLLPGLAPLQNDMQELTSMTRKIIKNSALIIVPLFMGLAGLAEPLVIILLGEKWKMAIPIMQIVCIARLITVISGINVNLLYVLGRSDWALKQQYWKIAVRILLLAAALPFGIIVIAIAELMATIIHFFINTYYPGKIMKYGALQQLKDFSRIALSGTIMVIMILLTVRSFNNNWLSLLTGLLIGTATYIFFLKILRVNQLDQLIGKLKQFVKKS